MSVIVCHSPVQAGGRLCESRNLSTALLFIRVDPAYAGMTGGDRDDKLN